MSKTKKKPPMKLSWAEGCRAWLMTLDQDHLPVSKVAAQAMLLVLVLSANNDGTGALVSARWAESHFGLSAARVVRPFLVFLVTHRWLVGDGKDRETQAKRYTLVIPPNATEPVAPSQADPDTNNATDSVASSEGLAISKVRPQVRPGRPPLPTLEVGEESGAGAPLTSQDNGTAKVHILSVAEVGRLRGVLEQVAANRPAVDAHGFNERNTDLQQEWHRLDRGGWDARKIDLALPRPKSVRSDTGWLLSQFRDLPTNPDQEPRVVEAQVLLLAWLHMWTQDDPERLARNGVSVDEYHHLIDQAKAHGYLLDSGTWTDDAVRLTRQAEDFRETDDDPKWGLIHQAMEVASMKA